MSLKSWLKDTIYVASQVGIALQTGQTSYGVPAPVKCRVEYETRVVIGVDAEEHVSKCNIVTDTEIKIADRVWLPGKNPASVSQASKILAIQSATSKQGTVKMWTVYL